MSRFSSTSVYVIRQVSTGQLIKFSSNKCGWSSVGAAKNAFNLHMKSHFDKDWSEGKGLFNEQSEFIIEEIE